ncbi:MAG: PEP-CTERM sorting domain-containing protein, partial [Planctomycetia bacterium]|nr:PEP-CTERM sorting domain-containing protein [Planctomycetia bacterium]
YQNNVSDGAYSPNLTKTGEGILNFTGTYTVEAGTTNLVANGGVFHFIPTNVNLADGVGSLQINHGATLTYATSTDSQMGVNSANALQFGTGGGTFTTNGNFYFAENTTVSTVAGTAENVTKNVINGTGWLNLNGKTVEFNVAENSTLDIQAQLYNGSNTIDKTGAGTLRLSNNMNFSGFSNNILNVKEGTVQLAVTRPSDSNSTVNVSIASTLELVRTDVITNYNLYGDQLSHVIIENIPGYGDVLNSTMVQSGTVTIDTDSANFRLDFGGREMSKTDLNGFFFPLVYSKNDFLDQFTAVLISLNNGQSTYSISDDMGKSIENIQYNFIGEVSWDFLYLDNVSDGYVLGLHATIHNVVDVPEPSTIILLLLGMAFVGVRFYRGHRRA